MLFPVKPSQCHLWVTHLPSSTASLFSNSLTTQTPLLKTFGLPCCHPPIQPFAVFHSLMESYITKDGFLSPLHRHGTKKYSMNSILLYRVVIWDSSGPITELNATSFGPAYDAMSRHLLLTAPNVSDKITRPYTHQVSCSHYLFQQAFGKILLLIS